MVPILRKSAFAFGKQAGVLVLVLVLVAPTLGACAETMTAVFRAVAPQNPRFTAVLLEGDSPSTLSAIGGEGGYVNRARLVKVSKQVGPGGGLV